MIRGVNTHAAVISLLVGFVVLTCGLIAAQDIKTNYLPSTDFSKYKTYKWVVVTGAEHPDQIVDQQIKQAIDAQFSAKGMTKTEDEMADVYVAYQVSVRAEQEWNAYGTGMGPRWGGMGTVTSTTIHIGTLDLDLYDTRTQKLVWRGMATKTLNPSKDPAKNQKRLNKAVAKLLKGFPPKAK